MAARFSYYMYICVIVVYHAPWLSVVHEQVAPAGPLALVGTVLSTSPLGRSVPLIFVRHGNTCLVLVLPASEDSSGIEHDSVTKSRL